MRKKFRVLDQRTEKKFTNTLVKKVMEYSDKELKEALIKLLAGFKRINKHRKSIGGIRYVVLVLNREAILSNRDLVNLDIFFKVHKLMNFVEEKDNKKGNVKWLEQQINNLE